MDAKRNELQRGLIEGQEEKQKLAITRLKRNLNILTNKILESAMENKLPMMPLPLTPMAIGSKGEVEMNMMTIDNTINIAFGVSLHIHSLTLIDKVES